MTNKSLKSFGSLNVVLYILILFIAVSCHQDIEPKINNSIQNLIEKFPQLTAQKKSVRSAEFKFIKSIKEGEFNIEIRLYSQPEGYKNRNHILVFINGKKEIYSVPLFNNIYKDYWEFPLEKPLSKIPKTNTSFSNELNTAINELINNNDRKKSQKRYTMIDVTLNSVLNCTNVKAKDSLVIYTPTYTTLDTPDENIDSAKVRLRKNYDMMKLNKQYDSFASNCYLDEKNCRIYQIEYHGNKVKIKTYRIDYGTNIHPIYL
ncbi:hypothetical protein [Flavobacterium limi]|uniref:Lipoprotein n=1 Tax=Flavobacterium limi TaxID=2045105 RepID=A0ABQ1TSK8_9FLAO|nr:hypothetical protein [Flavobacterium limi]GGF00542.1 hypothetical protein GCM10011518_07400 [Flavobacterium limi]